MASFERSAINHYASPTCLRRQGSFPLLSETDDKSCGGGRFQITVKADLEKTPIKVIEITQSLSPSMQEIQTAVKELMAVLTEELKKSEHFDSFEFTAEDCFSSNFDERVRRLLHPKWYTFSWKVKQIVRDLTQLRELLLDLMTHDAVTFLSFLEKIQMTGGDTIWQFHDAANTIFEQAKRRVYVLELQGRDKEDEKKTGRKRKQQDTHDRGMPFARKVLEPLPKWDALKEVLTEVHEDIRLSSESNHQTAKRVLVVCKEMFMKNQLRWAIEDPQKLLEALFNEYIAASQRSGDSSNVLHRHKKQEGPLKCGFSLYVKGDLSEALSNLRPAVTPVEAIALDNTAHTLETNRPPRRKEKQKNQTNKMDGEEFENEPRISSGSMLYLNEDPKDNAEIPALLQNVHFYPLDSKNDSVLWEVEPDYVIMYHPNVAFLRQIEVYQAENLEKPIKLYLIYYDNSIEQTTFERQVEKETEVFTKFIENRGKLSIRASVPSTQDPDPSSVEVAVTEKQRGRGAAGNGSTAEKYRRYKIIVDMREFMSNLPAVLHRAQFKITPVTLETGDYVLTPDIVVERKTVPDLYSSLRSGRLFNQADALTRKFNIPILLIEFDDEMQFRLQSDSEITKEISSQSLTSRLVLLILHFPRLRLIWSPSPVITCRIFDKLKRNRSEPEIDEVEEEKRKKHCPKGAENEKGVDILKKLPGVTESNCRKLMRGCNSLAELSKISQERLEEIMDSKRNAKALFSFMHAPCPRL